MYPGWFNAPDAERQVIFYGRCGRPIKKPCFITAERAQQLARKLHARRLSIAGGAVGARGLCPLARPGGAAAHRGIKQKRDLNFNRNLDGNNCGLNKSEVTNFNTSRHEPLGFPEMLPKLDSARYTF